MRISKVVASKAVPQMPTDAAEVCARLIKHARSNAPFSHRTITLTDREVLH